MYIIMHVHIPCKHLSDMFIQIKKLSYLSPAKYLRHLEQSHQLRMVASLPADASLGAHNAT